MEHPPCAPPAGPGFGGGQLTVCRKSCLQSWICSQDCTNMARFLFSLGQDFHGSLNFAIEVFLGSSCNSGGSSG